mmetsp:Transcript_15898/g.44144  ORF Transcript_15898/g.44144 Transcript_15898/m.44144 type:complete len:138 (+) Transcript_15898:66-479(+)
MAAMDIEPPACIGVPELAAMPHVARRVNFKLFQQAEAGAAVRVGGRLSASSSGQGRVLTTTDGGSLEVSEVDGSLPPEVAGGAFVEVVGTKAGDGALRTTGIVAMPGKEPMVDAELWDEAVKLAELPQLRELFTPLV